MVVVGTVAEVAEIVVEVEAVLVIVIEPNNGCG